jgi:4-hydroxybenzoate polyprenyltransferase
MNSGGNPSSVFAIKPLCIDCDGTLIRTDLLHESLIRIILRKPLILFSLIPWIFRGRAYLKSKLALLVHPEFSVLPFRDEVLNLARERKKMGGKVILATASHGILARKLADQCAIFDEVLASDEGTNLKGEAKRSLLVQRFGERGFDYAGDSCSDFVVWSSSHTAIVVGDEPFANKVGRIHERVIHLNVRAPSARSWFKLLRLHQWAKNLIIFVPLATSQRIFEIPTLLQALTAFFSFSFLASATYIFNDLCDLDNDRAHATKRSRPLADGTIGLPEAAFAAILLGLFSIGTGVALGLGFVLVLAAYFCASILYSSIFKKSALIDVIVLAGLYIWRLVAGGVATGIVLSNWLMSFALFIFTSLALAKRYVEISDSPGQGSEKYSVAVGRGYRAGDSHLVFALGVSSALVSVLVVLLYVSSPDVVVLYKNPQVLFLLAPPVLFWISRIWLLASRGGLNEDPVLFAVKDKCSYAVAAFMLGVVIVATFGFFDLKLFVS